ncbi:MAG TPA: hypothetical protein VG796_18755 [Verrucomicrobiales bacterium]|nr:hypothetical protein [Verrucomicrobiales bacterium]
MNTVSASGPAPAWCLWKNPILRRYFRTRLRPRGLGAALILTLIVAGFIFTISRIMGLKQMEYANARIAANPDSRMFMLSMEDVERMCLLPLMAVQAFILFIVGTGQVAGGMTADADEGTMDYMRLSPMTPLAKVLGYLFGLPIREWIMFASTLPFTAWAIWRGGVSAEYWVPVYGVILVAAILYHLTGLTAGTVLRNRRWAFLLSMGTVFLLYTLVPQLANLGLVYFEYLTIWPVLTENMHAFMPKAAGEAIRVANMFLPDDRFFNLGFPKVVFTVFSQLVLCVTYILMLWRRWRRSESHLMGKAWATGLFIWGQIVLLGCSIPLIEHGLLFMTRRINMRFSLRRLSQEGWSPDLSEAMLMVSIFGTVSLLALFLLGMLIAPSRDDQARGARRAVKLGRRGPSLIADEAPSLLFVTIMALAGGAGWTIFANQLIGSHWFPGQVLPAWTPVAFATVLLTAGLGAVLVYELWGIKGVFLSAVFIGVVPILVGTILAASASQLSTASVWITGASPLMAPSNAVATVLPDGLGIHDPLRLAAPRAFLFWQVVMVFAVIWMFAKHRALHRARYRRGIAEGGEAMQAA